MWILFAAISAVANATRNILSKRSVDTSNEYITMWATNFFALIFGVVMVLVSGFIVSDKSFWGIVALRVLLDSVAFVAFIRALKFKTVSFAIPLLSFVPVFSSITSFIINGQSLSPLGIFGIIVICTGNLLLFTSELDFRKLNNNSQLIKTTALILACVMTWAFLDPIHKEGVDRSNPATYFFVGSASFSMIFTVVAFVKARKELLGFFKSKGAVMNASLGILLGFEFGAQLIALTTGLTSFVSAIKSTNVGISSLFAWKFLKEEISGLKAIAIAISVVGVLIVSLSS